MKRIKRIFKQGASYCITLPKAIITEKMLKNGVYLDVLSFQDDEAVLKVKAANGKHNPHNRNSRKNT